MIFWVNGSVCVCVLGSVGALGPIIQSAGHHGQPDHLAHRWQRVSPANMPRARDSCTRSNTDPWLQVLKHQGFCLMLCFWNKARPHFKWKKIRLALRHRCCCFDSAYDHIWHLALPWRPCEDSLLLRHQGTFILLRFCYRNSVSISCEGSASAERVNVVSVNWNKCERAGPEWSDWHRV